MMHAGSGAMQGYGAPGMAGAGSPGTLRNPVMVLVMSMLCGFYAMFALFSMLSELRAYTGKEEIVPWHIFIPIYNIVVLIKSAEWVTEAKQRAGCRDPQSAGPLLYFLLSPYFMAKDLNEVWNPMGALPQG
jgi:heme/copper-type cytochrome/quinol oxidase subunit 3